MPIFNVDHMYFLYFLYLTPAWSSSSDESEDEAVKVEYSGALKMKCMEIHEG